MTHIQSLRIPLRKRNFIVYQFVYNEQLLKSRDVDSIYNSILNILKYKKFIDPLRNTERKAQPNTLESNYIVQEGKEIKSIKESLSHQYDLMYKLGCISEEQLRNMKNTVI